MAVTVAAPRWIIDGNYSGTLPLWLAAADAVVVLDLRPWLCAWRVVRRVVTLRGAVRPDMADGCPERLTLAFLWYVLTFRLAALPRIETALSAYHRRVVRLRSRSDVARFQASPFNS